MNESDLTPEFIAEKILGWEYLPEGDLGDRAHWKDEFGIRPNPLPTFKESEWTGILLGIAAKIGNVSLQLYSKGTDNYAQIYKFQSNLLLGRGEDMRENYAIILAICEAKGL